MFSKKPFGRKPKAPKYDPAEELGESAQSKAEEAAEGEPEPKSRDGALSIVISHVMGKRKPKLK